MSQPLPFESIEVQLPTLRRFAPTLTHDRDAADDLVQDSMLRGIANKEKFAPGSDMRRWLFTIMHNLFCDQYRQRQRRGHQVPLKAWQKNVPQAEGQSQAVRLLEVAEAFERLSGSQRRLLVMIGVDGVSHERAAEYFGVAVGTIKSRLSRARAHRHQSQRGIARRKAGPQRFANRPPGSIDDRMEFGNAPAQVATAMRATTLKRSWPVLAEALKGLGGANV